MPPIDLIELYNRPDIRKVSEFGSVTGDINVNDLIEGYHHLVQNAPARYERGKEYLSGRDGISSSGSYSNRDEEHLALALYNASLAGEPFEFDGGRSFKFINYQTPLKARQDDKGIGKIDLLAVIDDQLPCVVELKVEGSKGSLGETPLRALLEGFTYCAIYEANDRQIAQEAQETMEISLTSNRPALAVMAPEKYWRDYLTRHTIAPWQENLNNLVSSISEAMQMEIHLLALRNSEFEHGLSGNRARLIGDCQILTLYELLTSKAQ